MVVLLNKDFGTICALYRNHRKYAVMIGRRSLFNEWFGKVRKEKYCVLTIFFDRKISKIILSCKMCEILTKKLVKSQQSSIFGGNFLYHPKLSMVKKITAKNGRLLDLTSFLVESLLLHNFDTNFLKLVALNP